MKKRNYMYVILSQICEPLMLAPTKALAIKARDKLLKESNNIIIGFCKVPIIQAEDFIQENLH